MHRDGCGALAIAGTAAAGLGASAAVAARDAVPAWELAVARRLGRWPDGVAMAMYPVMQLGAAAAPSVVALGIAARGGDRTRALTVLGSGMAAWFGAKGVKALVRRERPAFYAPEILVRDGDGTGLGFPSGHAAVSASIAVVVGAASSATARALLATAAVAVGSARVVHGVHLPLDVVGGWSFGALVGLGGLAAGRAVRGWGTGPGPRRGP